MENIQQSFGSVTIFLLTSNETSILRKTVEIIKDTCNKDDIEKIVIVLKSDNCPGYFEAEKIISEKSEYKTEMYIQKSSNVFSCIAELPPLVKSSHFLIMASDMEMNPKDVSEFIRRAKLYPKRIICGSKWHKDSVVSGYGIVHELGSRIVNLFIGVLYNKKVRDAFSIFQIYPLSVYRAIKFDRPEQFPFEYTLKPLRVGLEYEEIPTVYIKRTEGKSNFNLIDVIKFAFNFCLTAIRIRFTSKENFYEEK